MHSQRERTSPPFLRTAIHRWRMVAAVMLLVLPGCGRGPTGEVAGKLTLQGQPVTQGSVVFFQAAGVPVGMAGLSATGEFQLRERLPAGTYLVAFHFDDGAVAGAPDTGPDVPGPSVPSKYWDENTSGLAVEVKPGANTFELNVE
ncbi:MAG: hypothetical protein RBS80_11055 [Thermoguttaceae bacterium]|nr:hypothetical protein [Thermoguttaceae bacterium]